LPPSTVSPALRDGLIEQMGSLRAFAVSLCGDRERADDLVQETLYKAWNHLDSFKEGTNLKAWLFTILRGGSESARWKMPMAATPHGFRPSRSNTVIWK
jgi:RNA polymerase sigma-70 factor (ECF subfamily)